jgi:predicted ribosome quality control (RQC) complex YloA/Tae2 family protein
LRKTKHLMMTIRQTTHAISPSPDAPPQRLDALTVEATCSEMETLWRGAKLQKIVQLSPVEYAIEFWKPNPEQRPELEENWLYLHLNRQHPFFCMVSETQWKAFFPNAKTGNASPLLLSLRKYLQGARLERVESLAGEPLLSLTFHYVSDLGFQGSVQLVTEFMGKYTNLILVDAPTQRILQIMHVVDEDQSRLRPLHVGGNYSPPPRPEGRTPFQHLNLFDVFEASEPYTPANAFKHLQQQGWGISKPLLLPLLEGCTTHEEAIATLRPLQQGYNPHVQQTPTGVLLGYHGIHVQGYSPFSGGALATLHAYYWPWRSSRLLEQHKNKLRQPIRQRHRTLLEGLKRLNESRVKEATIARFQEEGDVLMTLHSMRVFQTPKPLSTEFTPEINPLTGEAGVPIPVDLKRTWVENAQACYRKVQKAHGRNRYADVEGQRLQGELAYIETLEVLLEHATRFEALPLLEEDWIQAGLLPKPKVQGRKNKHAKPKIDEASGIESLLSPNGVTVLVGRSSKGNGALVSKQLRPMDIWCHAGEGIPGSHVVVKLHGTGLTLESVPDEDLKFATQLAAWFSAGQESAKVPVMFTLGKHVRAIPGSWPGHVNHSHEETVMVAPKL